MRSPSDLPRSSTISIAMATFNGERYLPEMLDSLAAQSRRPDELVVRDDGSADGTLAILRAFAARAPFPVRIMPAGERLGYAQNFVTASRACFGGLLFFADQDDVWHADKLATVAAAAPYDEPVAVFHDFTLASADGAVVAPSFYGVLAQRGFSPALALKGCAVALTRPFIDTWGWPPATSWVPHDSWAALLSTAFGQRLILDDVLIDHRLHESNRSGWIPDITSRTFTVPSDGSTDVELLIDLLVKRRRLGARTRALVEVTRQRGDAVDPVAAEDLRRALRRNRRRYRDLVPRA